VAGDQSMNGRLALSLSEGPSPVRGVFNTTVCAPPSTKLCVCLAFEMVE